MRLACVVGLSGERLSDAEARFLKDAAPAGLILFSRNVVNREQMRRLIGEARDCIGADDALVMIDQEGGPVQRLAPPEWLAYPPARIFGEWYEDDPDTAREALALVARLIAEDLAEIGINTNCVPVADLPTAGAHDVIGIRAYGKTDDIVVPLARAAAQAHLDACVLPVVKHVPGHGRTGVDSHLELPVVETPKDELAATDFAPFRALADLPIMMTAHVVFSALDASAPASISRMVHDEIIRGEIGFDGLLVSDDLSMQALEGEIGRRAGAVINAGSDLALHCNGELVEMEAVAAAVPQLKGRASERLELACARCGGQPEPFDRAAAEDALAMARDKAERARK